MFRFLRPPRYTPKRDLRRYPPELMGLWHLPPYRPGDDQSIR